MNIEYIKGFMNIEYIEEIGRIIDELKIEDDINHNMMTSYKVLEIYFNKKLLEDKERILRDSLFGC